LRKKQDQPDLRQPKIPDIRRTQRRARPDNKPAAGAEAQQSEEAAARHEHRPDHHETDRQNGGEDEMF